MDGGNLLCNVAEGCDKIKVSLERLRVSRLLILRYHFVRNYKNGGGHAKPA